MNPYIRLVLIRYLHSGPNGHKNDASSGWPMITMVGYPHRIPHWYTISRVFQNSVTIFLYLTILIIGHPDEVSFL